MSQFPPRFWGYVLKSPHSCWVWLGALTPQGYGSFRIDGAAKGAHRLAYEDAHGPIPSGLVIDHICRHRGCVNPAHLRAVTHRENILAGTGSSARCASATTCPKGHPYDAENTVWTKRGTRVCRQCQAAYQRRYFLRNRERLLAYQAAYKRRNREVSK